MPPLTELERATQESYDKKFGEWMERSSGRDRECYWKNEMSEYLAYLDRGKKVLEIGCGPATDGKYLLESGCSRVVSVDFSVGMLKMAGGIHNGKKPVPQLTAMDVYKLGLPDDQFDGFWASASLLHLEYPKEALAEIRRVTKRKGIGFISVKEGEGKEFDAKKKILYVYHHGRVFKDLLERSGMETIDFERRKGYSGHDWLNFFVRVNK